MAPTKDKTFSLEKLVETFSTFCPDIHCPEEDIEKTRKSVGFACEVLWHNWPDSMKTNKLTATPIKFYKDANLLATVYVTSAECTLNTIQPELFNDQLILNLEQAGLLSVYIMLPLIRVTFDKRHKFAIYPMAEDIFYPFECLNMAVASCRQPMDVILEVCASCQVGGHHLEGSVGALGVLAAVALGRKIKKKAARDEFIVNVFEDYLLAGKRIDKAVYKLYTRIVKGGLPRGYEFEEVVQMVKTHKRSKPDGVGKRLTLFPRGKIRETPDGADSMKVVQLSRCRRDDDE